MVYLNAKVNGIICTLAEFGKGDISIMNNKSLDENKVIVLFKNTEPFEIGEYDEDGPQGKFEDIKPEAVLTFTNPKSIDVLIKVLNEAKNKLENV